MRRTMLLYSITSSERTRKVSGIVKPTAFAAFRLTASLKSRRVLYREVGGPDTFENSIHIHFVGPATPVTH
jgi:hypothetical protein